MDSAQEQSRKRKHDESISSTRQDKEDAIDSVFTDLYEKHQDAYTKPQLRLWARMITCGIHESYNDPSDVPMITGKTPKQYKKESLSDAIVGAPVAVVNAVKPTASVNDQSSPNSKTDMTTPPIHVGISPGKSVDLRMKNL